MKSENMKCIHCMRQIKNAYCRATNWSPPHKTVLNLVDQPTAIKTSSFNTGIQER